MANWVSAGCGVIANELAQAMEKRGQKLYGVVNRTQEKAVAFAEKYGVQNVFTSFEEVCADPAVDIIYISTPHNTHIHFLRKALAAGKHVLCEKSITLNSGELEEAMQLAKEHGVVLAEAITLNSDELNEMAKLADKNHVIIGEAMTIYHMPIYKELLKRVDAGDLGELRVIQMNFGSYKEYDMKNRFFNRNLAGGALLDIGVYALSFVRMFLSSCPDQIASQVKFAPTGVDEQAGILLMNPKKEMATVTLSLHAKQPKRGMLSFDKAYVEMYEYPRGQKAVITYTEDGHTEELRAGATADALVYEVEDMERAIAGQPEVMKLKYTEDVMRMMTEIRKQWGLIYPEEE